MLTKYVTRCEKKEAKFVRQLFDPQKKLILNNVSYSSCSWQPSNGPVLLAVPLSHCFCISLFRLYPFSSLTFCLFTQTAVYIFIIQRSIDMPKTTNTTKKITAAVSHEAQEDDGNSILGGVTTFSNRARGCLSHSLFIAEYLNPELRKQRQERERIARMTRE